MKVGVDGGVGAESYSGGGIVTFRIRDELAIVGVGVGVGV